ncbi:hypothetical protein V502_09893 [Pseudogymnoascus sp. VKM F-4520 (FW-2644)]|nr:hypothetical protein V502_09893 [Pseudogymnoascus sp. VKM F-4520 (FW-2644)]
MGPTRQPPANAITNSPYACAYAPFAPKIPGVRTSFASTIYVISAMSGGITAASAVPRTATQQHQTGDSEQEARDGEPAGAVPVGDGAEEGREEAGDEDGEEDEAGAGGGPGEGAGDKEGEDGVEGGEDGGLD